MNIPVTKSEHHNIWLPFHRYRHKKINKALIFIILKKVDWQYSSWTKPDFLYSK